MTAAETQLVFARAVLLVLLYGFVGVVAWLTWLELRAERRGDPASMPEGVAARLIVLDGGQSGRAPGHSFGLEPVTTLGRDLANHVVLVDPTVSGHHAVINQREGAWWIEDLCSTNGTYVNGVRLAAEAPGIVRSGDVLHLGALRLRLVTPEL